MPIGEFIGEVLLRGIFEIVFYPVSYYTGAVALWVLTLGQVRIAPLTTIESTNRRKNRWTDWSIWLHRPLQGRVLKADCVCLVGLLLWIGGGVGMYFPWKAFNSEKAPERIRMSHRSFMVPPWLTCIERERDLDRTKNQRAMFPMSNNNKTTLEKANAAIAAGDNEKFLSFCTDDTEWTYVGDKTLKGKDAVRQYLAASADDPSKFSVTRLIAEGDFLTALGDITIKDEQGQMVHHSYCDVWRFRDGKMAELRAFVIKTEVG